jgi:adenosylhomocysteine nucleosidase
MGTPDNQPANLEHDRRVLVVAALGRELAALRRAADPRLALLETGEGIENARRAVTSWLDSQTPRAVVGIGFAGALSDSLKLADLLVARESRTSKSESVAATQAMLEAAGRAHGDGAVVRFGVSVTVSEVVCLAEGKRRLAMTLGPDEIACVDMESFAIARACAERGIPFVIARCITDLYAEDLPVDFNRCRRGDGRISNWRVVASVLRRPASFAALWVLRRRSMVCSQKLATFVGCLVSELEQAVSDR